MGKVSDGVTTIGADVLEHFGSTRFAGLSSKSTVVMGFLSVSRMIWFPHPLEEYRNQSLCIARASWLDTMESLMLEGFSVQYLVASKHDSSFLRWPDHSELQQYNFDNHGKGLTHFLLNRREQSSFMLMSI